jgi:predicted kinase
MPKPNDGKNQSLTLIRGLPGSGKSTLAASLASATDGIHLEADMFMVDRRGFYKFDVRRLKQTHSKCEAECREALEDGKNVVISNTFTRFWEMKPYINMAKHLDMPLQIIECHARFGSIHQVPEETLEDMRDRWEELPAQYR